MTVAAIIPARNEEPTVGDVVAAAGHARLVDEVIVVDNDSSDRTAEVAAARGARVVSEPVKGKGEAMRAGIRATNADFVVFLDADLVGLQPEHVDALVDAVRQGAGMACGLFDRGRLLNPLFEHVLPALTGERALRRKLFEALAPKDLHGYRVEAALNSEARASGVPVVRFVCPGLWHRPKEEKSPSPLSGFVAKVAMLFTAMAEYVSSGVRRRRRVAAIARAARQAAKPRGKRGGG